MSRVIAVASQKGGVGKTTTAVNLGFALSRFGNRILMIDGDPQGGMAIASNLNRRTHLGLIHLLRNEHTPKEVIATTKDGRIAAIGMGEMEPEDLRMLEDEAQIGNLGTIVRDMADGYDYAIIDAPAGMGGLVSALLGISTSVLIPLNCRAISVKSLPPFLKLIHWLKDSVNPALILDGIVLTMVDSTRASEQEILEDIQELVPERYRFETAIPYDEMFEVASQRAVPAGMLKNGQAAARCYRDLALELQERQLARETAGESDEQISGLF